jgi:DNA end-binding protein Ku
VPDGKVGHDAYAVIRDTIKDTGKVALARVVLTNREHIIALEARDNGLVGLLLRYPYEVRDAADYFDDIKDVKITKDMLDLAKHIVEQKKAGHPIAKAKVKTEGNVINLMDALRQSLKGGKAAPAAAKAAPAKGKKSRKRVEGQREMLFPIEGKKAAKEPKREPAKRAAKTTAANKTSTAKRKAG